MSVATVIALMALAGCGGGGGSGMSQATTWATSQFDAAGIAYDHVYCALSGDGKGYECAAVGSYDILNGGDGKGQPNPNFANTTTQDAYCDGESTNNTPCQFVGYGGPGPGLGLFGTPMH